MILNEFENIITLKLQRMLHAYLLLQVPPTVTTICQETNGSGKWETFSPYSQDNPSSSVVAPAQISAKPSALRMPSPSVGFFTQVIYYALSYIFTNVVPCFLSDMKITWYFCSYFDVSIYFSCTLSVYLHLTRRYKLVTWKRIKKIAVNDLCVIIAYVGYWMMRWCENCLKQEMGILQNVCLSWYKILFSFLKKFYFGHPTKCMPMFYEIFFFVKISIPHFWLIISGKSFCIT